jgi:hypothetical protein
MMVEGTMTHKPSRIILCVFALLFISQLPFFSTQAQQAMTTENFTPENNPELLIILSPQKRYRNPHRDPSVHHRSQKRPRLEIDYHRHTRKRKRLPTD